MYEAQIIEKLKEQWDRDPKAIYMDAANALSDLTNRVRQLQSEVDAMGADEKELSACRDRCAVLEKAAEEWRNRLDAEQTDSHRLRTKNQELTQELNRLKDQRQQWLDRDRDNQIVIQTLKDVISDLR